MPTPAQIAEKLRKRTVVAANNTFANKKKKKKKDTRPDLKARSDGNAAGDALKKVREKRANKLVVTKRKKSKKKKVAQRYKATKKGFRDQLFFEK